MSKEKNEGSGVKEIKQKFAVRGLENLLNLHLLVLLRHTLLII